MKSEFRAEDLYSPKIKKKIPTVTRSSARAYVLRVPASEEPFRFPI